MDEAHNKLLERLRTYYGDDLACRTLLMDARHALEALAGEVENLKHDIARHMTIANEAAAERDRLKAALEKARHELVTHNGLYATDIYPENREQLLQNGVNIEWQIDVSAVLETIDAALGGAS